LEVLISLEPFGSPDDLCYQSEGAMFDHNLRSAEIIILVCSVTDMASFTALDSLREKAKSMREENNIPIYAIFGNKTDLKSERVVQEASIREKAAEWKCSWAEGSALESKHSILNLVEQCTLQSLKLRGITSTSSSSSPSSNSNSGDGRSCAIS